MQVTEIEKDSFMLYQGTLNNASRLGIDTSQYKMTEIYTILNSLMFDDCHTECIRVTENKQLAASVLNNIDKVREVYKNIFSLMKKYKKSYSGGNIEAMRTERENGLVEMQKHKRTISFTSTSQNPDSYKKYFLNKKRLVIQKFLISKSVPFLCAVDVFGPNIKFAEENEVLLPPFLEVDIERMELSNEEWKLRDADNKPPIGKYKISVNGIASLRKYAIEDISISLEKLTDKKEIEIAVDTVGIINNRESPREDNLRRYIEWKKCFQKVIYKDFCDCFNV